MSQNRLVQGFSSGGATFALPSFVDTSKPNLARVFNYLAGGSAYFEVDRVAAEQMLLEFPPLRKLVQIRKAFAFEAVAYLYGVEGFRQFLDLGSGIPSGDALHEMVPDAAFIYSDINPVAVSYGTHLFAGLERVAYVHGDSRKIGALLGHEEVVQRLRFDEPVAVGLNNVPLFLSEGELQVLVQTLYERLAVGSQLSLFLQADMGLLHGGEVEEVQQKLRRMGIPARYVEVEKVCQLLQPWKLKVRELATGFMGLPADFLDDAEIKAAGLVYYALFFVKE